MHLKPTDWVMNDLSYSKDTMEIIYKKFKEYGMDGEILLSCDYVELREYGIDEFVCIHLTDCVSRANKTYRSLNSNNLTIKNITTVSPKYPDCVSFETSGNPRCVMSCGHAITAPSMHQLIHSYFFVFFFFVFALLNTKQIIHTTKQCN